MPYRTTFQVDLPDTFLRGSNGTCAFFAGAEADGNPNRGRPWGYESRWGATRVDWFDRKFFDRCPRRFMKRQEHDLLPGRAGMFATLWLRGRGTMLPRRRSMMSGRRSKMSRLRAGGGAFWSALLVILMAVATPAAAQNDSGDLFPELSLGSQQAASGEPVTWSARYLAGPEATTGRVEVKAKLANRWHLYSLTQKPGGPLPTKLSIQSPDSVRTTSAWSPDEPPAKSVSKIYGGLTVEEHAGSVVWSAPIELPPDYRDEIQVVVEGLVCKTDGSCVPVEQTLTAEHQRSDQSAEKSATADETSNRSGPPTEEAPSSSFREEDYVVQWTATIDRDAAVAGSGLAFSFTAKPDAGFHVYEAAVTDEESSTIFVVTQKSQLKFGEPQPSSPAVTHQTHPVLPPVSYHPGEVTWSLPVSVPREARPGEHKIAGLIAYQACTDKSCRQPKALKFTATLNVAENRETVTLASPIELTSAEFASAADAAATTQWVDQLAKPNTGAGSSSGDTAAGDQQSSAPSSQQSDGTVSSNSNEAGDSSEASVPAKPASTPMSFPAILALAFLGGVILNVMPCVLPVVGLKVMSFVQQAGENRSRVLFLNLVYTLGILSVFALLAGLAVALSFSWGEQFTYFPVRLGLTLVLFALALSYLGVWEIPVPGFAAGQASQELQNREGYTGAFAKGVFATILATPCSGPLLGYILGLTLGLSAVQTVTIILMVGVGMALPYVIIGFQPRLVSWLPQPGPWMETLKQFLAFLFLGTVAFFFAGFNEEHKVPVFVALIGVWFGCWLIGQVPRWQSLNRQLLAWTSGIAAAAIIGLASFHYLVPGPKVLAWEPYSEARLNELRAEGKTVLVDFSAKWCVNCIVNYNVAINTAETRETMDELNAVALYADWTDRNPEIKAKLQELNSRSIPLLAIYPGDEPNQPIILRDLVSQSDVVEALQQAGESNSGSAIADQRPAPREVVQVAR